jgi:hypothetical protein
MGELIKQYDWLSVFHTHSLPVDVNDLSMVVRASKVARLGISSSDVQDIFWQCSAAKVSSVGLDDFV